MNYPYLDAMRDKVAEMVETGYFNEYLYPQSYDKMAVSPQMIERAVISSLKKGNSISKVVNQLERMEASRNYAYDRITNGLTKRMPEAFKSLFPTNGAIRLSPSTRYQGISPTFNVLDHINDYLHTGKVRSMFKTDVLQNPRDAFQALRLQNALRNAPYLSWN